MRGERGAKGAHLATGEANGHDAEVLRVGEKLGFNH